MLRRVLSLLRRTPPDPATRRFASQALLLLEQARRRRDDWHVQVELTADYHSLANLAAVRRWELARLAERMSAIESTPPTRRQAEEGARAMLVIAEGFQRLAHGYRSSKFERVCEGHALLEAGWERCQRVWAELQAHRAEREQG